MTILWITLSVVLIVLLVWAAIYTLDENSGEQILIEHPEDPSYVRVRIGHPFPRWFGKRGVASGMTFNGTIRFDNLRPSRRLFVHEMMHILQEDEWGTWGLLWRWFTDRKGVEADAERRAEAWLEDDILEDEYEYLRAEWAAWAARRA